MNEQFRQNERPGTSGDAGTAPAGAVANPLFSLARSLRDSSAGVISQSLSKQSEKFTEQDYVQSIGQ